MLSDKIAVFNNGYVEQVGTPQEIYNRSGSEFVCDFIGDINKLGKEVIEEINKQAGGRLDTAKHAYIRLELIHFAPGEGRVALKGEIMDYDYNGLITKYRVRVGREVLRVIQLNDAGASFRQGQQIQIYLHPKDIMQF